MFDIGTVEIHTAKKMNIGLAKLPADADFPRINGMGHAGYGDEVIHRLAGAVLENLMEKALFFIEAFRSEKSGRCIGEFRAVNRVVVEPVCNRFGPVVLLVSIERPMLAFLISEDTQNSVLKNQFPP